MKTLLILGPPGAGKGTQAARIAAHLNLTHLSTGAIFRSHMQRGTELGKLAETYIDRGDYVPDHITDSMVKEHVNQTEGGILLDGYPRTLEQAKALEVILEQAGRKLDGAINLVVDREEVVRRMLHRAKIEHRPDDTEEVIRHRIHVYRQNTKPLIEHYAAKGELIDVDGTGSIDDVWGEILKALGEAN